MPQMPEGAREGILKGLYRFSPAGGGQKPRVQLLGSGAILNEVIAAQKILGEKYGVPPDVWSVTSYTQLVREAYACERWNLLHPLGEPRVPYVTQMLADAAGVVVGASDYLKVLPDSLSRWIGRPILSLGTDGFGRSEDRKALRDFFEVDARFVTVGALSALARLGEIDRKVVVQAMKDMDINPDKPNPATS